MAPLHAMNPVRLSFIRDCTCRHFARDAEQLRPLNGLHVLDVGCGAGLLSEPLARMGGTVTGIDPAEDVITAASEHAKASALDIDYRATTLERLPRDERFDLITALEVIEHVNHVDRFIAALVARLEPGGLVILSTLNRTRASFTKAIVGAEYVLGWLPRGTHSWRRFIKPAELARTLRRQGCQIEALRGMVYDVAKQEFSLSNDVDINYIVAAGVPHTAISSEADA